MTRSEASGPPGSVTPAADPAARAACMEIRIEVFVREQAVPLEAEQDAKDAEAFHVLARDPAGRPVATGRFYVVAGAAKIGRMAVRREARGGGWGRRVIEALEAEAVRRGLSHAVLDAQTHALGFYRRLGYLEEGPEFEDCGIPHRRMTKRLGPARS